MEASKATATSTAATSSTKMERKDSFDSMASVASLIDSLEASGMVLTPPVSSVSEFRLREKSGQFQPEPLLVADKSRFVLFPIKHTDVSGFAFNFLNL